MPPTGPRQAPLSLDEVLGWVTADGCLDTREAAEIKAQERRQLAVLVKSHRGSEPLTAAIQREIEASITPIELVASFNLKARDGRALSEDFLTELAAGRVGLPYVKLDPLKLDAAFVTSVFSKPFARKHGLVPLSATADELTVATYDPFDAAALEDLRRVTQKRVSLVMASKSDIQRLITEFFGFQKSVEHAERNLSESIDLGNLEQFVRLHSEREIEASDQHVVNAVEYLFSYAFQQRASDIHLEPKRERSEVRFRIDGALHRVNTMPLIVHRAVVNRIKTLARLDIGEKRRPQDGRIKTDFRGKPVEFRVSTLPVAFGEKVVLRIFDPQIAEVELSALGFFERDLILFEKLIRQPHGIILVTGPTGSGKTVSLYSCLNILNKPGVNISTVEDPVEIQLAGINQVNVNEKAGLDFASAMKAFLRQDPDIIMVGEIRDHETGDIAIKAAQTGHMVLSTLHTNDAPATLTRLINMGIPSYNVAASVNLITAQRLGRRLCSSCKKPVDIPPEALLNAGFSEADLDGSWQAYTAVGCPACKDTGYKGRVGIYQVMPVSEEINRLILKNGTSVDIAEQAKREGVLDLRAAGLLKVKQGQTSLEEVLAVTNE